MSGERCFKCGGPITGISTGYDDTPEVETIVVMGYCGEGHCMILGARCEDRAAPQQETP